jgi:DNA gyrase/topoisomerase IV subunit B
MWWNDSYHETVLPFTNNIPSATAARTLRPSERR